MLPAQCAQGHGAKAQIPNVTLLSQHNACNASEQDLWPTQLETG